MDPRTASLEAQFSRIEALLGSIQGSLEKASSDLDEIRGRISRLPTTAQLMGIVLAAAAVTGGWLEHMHGR